MIRIASWVSALLVSTQLALAGANGQDPVPGGKPVPTASQPAAADHPLSGNQPTSSASRPYYPSSGLTLERMNGLPLTRVPVYPHYYQPYYYQPYYYQPYPYYAGYPYYSFNTAYSYPHPFGLGGYYPPRVGGYYGGWGWGGWWHW